jgi:hypothetical protein
MRIRSQQMANISIAFSERLRDVFSRELRRQGLIPDAVPDEELKAVVKRDQAAAQRIGITEINDVWRFVALRHLPAFKNASPVVKAALKKILSDTTCPPATRINFVQRAVIKSLAAHSFSGGS